MFPLCPLITIVLLSVCLFVSASVYGHSLPATVIWEHLCCHLDVHRLTEWITYQYPSTLIDRPLTRVAPPTWPYNQPITGEMLEMIDRCTGYVKNYLLDLLARCAIV